MTDWTYLAPGGGGSDEDSWYGTDLVATLGDAGTDSDERVTYHLELAGVEGDARTPSHRGELTVLAWGWGLDHTPNPDDPHVAGSVDVQGVTVVRPIDQATPRLAAACAEGLTFPRGALSATRHHGDGREEDYFALRFEDLRVAAVDLAGLPGNGGPAERVGLEFGSASVRCGDEEYQVGP